LPQTGSAFARYERLVASQRIERDESQLSLVHTLEALLERLSEHRLARKSNALGWLFAKKGKPVTPKGLYIWGGVGRGKTMLMDMFFESAQVRRKRRVHFHAFMADVHERIHHWRGFLKAGKVKGDDPIEPVADALADEAWLLCFDEFAVTDITDAMILSRLFAALFARGVVVVATSNVVPDKLYEEGLNRALFIPFIQLLKDRMDVVELKSRTDFRLEKLGKAPVYHMPADANSAVAFDKAFQALTGLQQGKAISLMVHGHECFVPEAASGVARASFDDLCMKPYGAGDYLALAQDFHTLILENIPRMDATRRNEARRFILLIDVLYENNVKLLASAEEEADQLYKADSGNEAFAFDRTVSRLIEMRSDDYLKQPHGKKDSRGSGDTTGLVET
jgi:cell division protein ZapE